MYPLHDLNAFVAVAKTGSVRAGASRIHRTQSAVSQALARLEALVGFPLMDRSGYRIRLTDEGQQFAKRAEAMLEHASSLRRFADILAAGIEDRVRLAVHGALPPRCWAHSIATVGANFPDTVLEVESGEVDSPLRSLQDGHADMALLIQSPSMHGLSTLEHGRVGSLRFVAVVRRDMADRIDTLPQIIVSDFKDGGNFGVIEGRRHCRVSNHMAKVELIMQGLGWGSVPAELVERPIADGMLMAMERRHASPPASLDVYLYRLADRPHGPVCRALWETLTGGSPATVDDTNP